jgi:DNA-binding GntR family transcriptional regulator
MPTIDLTDDEVAQLAEVLEALGGGVADKRIPFLTAVGGPWTESIRSKLGVPVVAPFMDKQTMASALGRWAATNKTQEEVDELRAQVDTYAARDADARQAMTDLGVDMTTAGPFARDAFTKLAAEKLAADALLIEPA